MIGKRIIKLPQEKSLPRQHYNRLNGRRRKAKVSFSSVDEAERYMKKHRLRGMTAYRCNECNMYHIGHLTKSKKENEFSKSSGSCKA